MGLVFSLLAGSMVFRLMIDEGRVKEAAAADCRESVSLEDFVDMGRVDFPFCYGEYLLRAENDSAG